jgi:hypothetical protein
MRPGAATTFPLNASPLITTAAAAPAPAAPDLRELIAAAVPIVRRPDDPCSGPVDCFLACTRAHESDSSGGYTAVSSDGAFRGAYQFLQSTWDNAATGAGLPEYAGIPPETAPPVVQDAAAAYLYRMAGNAPWGGRC